MLDFVEKKAWHYLFLDKWPLKLIKQVFYNQIIFNIRQNSNIVQEEGVEYQMNVICFYSFHIQRKQGILNENEEEEVLINGSNIALLYSKQLKQIIN